MRHRRGQVKPVPDNSVPNSNCQCRVSEQFAPTYASILLVRARSRGIFRRINLFQVVSCMVHPALAWWKPGVMSKVHGHASSLCMESNSKTCHPIALGLHEDSLSLSALRLIYAPVSACRRCFNIHAMWFGVSLAFLPSIVTSLHLFTSSDFGLVFSVSLLFYTFLLCSSLCSFLHYRF